MTPIVRRAGERARALREVARVLKKGGKLVIADVRHTRAGHLPPALRVTVVAKTNILKRSAQPGSMMPEGLTDALTLDDFAALLAYVQSLKAP